MSLRPDIVIIAVVTILAVGAHVGVFLVLRRLSRQPPKPAPPPEAPGEPR